MEPKDWIAVAQVYATLAAAEASKSSGYHGVFSEDREKHRIEARQLAYKATLALRAAGVEDA